MMTHSTDDFSRLLTARYGDAAPASSPSQVSDYSRPVLETMLSHRSIRNYRTEPLPDGTLEILVAAAQSAATSSNLQTWSVVAVEDPERKAEAARLCADQEFIRQAPLFLLFCADLDRLKTISDFEGTPGAGIDYLEVFVMATIDATLAAQNVAIAAEALQLGICYVGAARNSPNELAELLRLPERVVVLFGLTVGVPASPDTTAVKPRLPQEAVLHRETYSTEERSEQLTRYNETLAIFNAGQGRTTPPWTRLSADRVATVESLRGRDRLREILNARGFDLK